MLYLLVSLALSQTLYISEERATLWGPGDSGYSYESCENPNEYTQDACSRRQAWPAGGEEVERVPAAVKIANKNYYFVNYKGFNGWIEENFFDPKTGIIKQNGYFYRQPGYHYARCRDNKSDKECVNRTFVRPGEQVENVAKNEISFGDDTYYFVKYRKGQADRYGWIHQESLSKVSIEKDAEEEDSPAPTQSTEGDYCMDCEIAKAEPQRTATPSPFLEAVNAAAAGAYKSLSEIEKFACIYSHRNIYGGEKNFSKAKFCQYYDKKKPSIKEQIEKASKAFDLPPAVIACTLLVESNMYHNPNEKDEYRGMGQFGTRAIVDLQRHLARSPYGNMWASYTKRPKSDFNSKNVREKGDVEMTVGGVALYMKWLLADRVPKSGCRDCSGSISQPNQKDLYLLTAGYNWSPYGLGKVAGKTTKEMKTTTPPPKETRNYFTKMDNCLAVGEFEKFNQKSRSNEYKHRGAQCDGPC